MVEAKLSDQSPECGGVRLSPWVTRSRRRGARGHQGARLGSVSSLFDDMDPDHSPLMKNLERKQRTGETMTEEDFLEPFPVFKRKMEREFDEITEQFKRLSIDNLDEEMAEAVTNFSINVMPGDSQEEEADLKENYDVQYKSECNKSIHCNNYVGTFLASQLAPLLMEDLINVLTNCLW